MGVIKGSFQKHLKGVSKGKSCSQGEGGLEVSPLLPPPENFNYTLQRHVLYGLIGYNEIGSKLVMILHGHVFL